MYSQEISNCSDDQGHQRSWKIHAQTPGLNCRTVVLEGSSRFVASRVRTESRIRTSLFGISTGDDNMATMGLANPGILNHVLSGSHCPVGDCEEDKEDACAGILTSVLWCPCVGEEGSVDGVEEDHGHGMATGATTTVATAHITMSHVHVHIHLGVLCQSEGGKSRDGEKKRCRFDHG